MPRGRKKVTEEKAPEGVNVMNVTEDDLQEYMQDLIPESLEASKRVGKLDRFKGYIPSIRSNEVYIIQIRIHLIDEMLGTAPSDPEIYKNYIGSKAPDKKKMEEELESMSVEDMAESKRTIFHKDSKKNPFIYDYMIRGFFKNACSALRDSKTGKSQGVSAHKSKIDKLVFAGPRRIKINMPKGGKIGICERPLRAQTPQGERVALASSETVPKDSTMTTNIVCFNKLMLECVFEWLDYGSLNGLGQWHNGSKGRFLWELIDRGTGETIEGGNWGLLTLGDILNDAPDNELFFDDTSTADFVDAMIEDVEAVEAERKELDKKNNK